jgi:hypothetical protein
VVVLREAVAFDECQRMIAGSHLLVVVDTPAQKGMFLPTKVVEYFAHEKPVLGIAEPESAVSDALSRCWQAVANGADSNALADALDAALTAHAEGRLQITEAARVAMRGYEIHQVNQPLIAQLEKLYAGLIRP